MQACRLTRVRWLTVNLSMSFAGKPTIRLWTCRRESYFVPDSTPPPSTRLALVLLASLAWPRVPCYSRRTGLTASMACCWLGSWHVAHPPAGPEASTCVSSLDAPVQSPCSICLLSARFASTLSQLYALSKALFGT